jgi:hypothetical protein
MPFSADPYSYSPDSSEHAFQYWHSSDGQIPEQWVSQDVIDFLNAQPNP